MTPPVAPGTPGDRMTLDGLVASAVEGLRHMRGSYHPARAVFVSTDGQLGMAVIDPRADHARMRLLLQNLAAETPLRLLVLVAEAWVTEAAAGSTRAADLLAGRIRVQDLPADDRFDAVVLYAEEAGRAPVSHIWRLTGDGQLGPEVSAVEAPALLRAFYPLLPANAPGAAPTLHYDGPVEPV